MPRPLWTGAISFGLVNIPVKMYRATASTSAKSVGFHQLHQECGTRLAHKRWCPKCDVEVKWEDVAKGYEVSKGRYAVVTERDLDQLLPEEDYAAIAIEHFVALDEVDAIFFDRSYYVSPVGAPKAYALLHTALVDSGRVAIARVTLRTRSHLAIVRTFQGRLLLSTMFFADEIADAHEVTGLPVGKVAHVDKRQLEAAEQLIASMTVPFDPTRYEDEYTKKVEKVLEDKINAGHVVEALEAPAGSGAVVNLLAALEKSVQANEQGAAPTGGFRLRQRSPAAKRSRRSDSRRPHGGKRRHAR